MTEPTTRREEIVRVIHEQCIIGEETAEQLADALISVLAAGGYLLPAELTSANLTQIAGVLEREAAGHPANPMQIQTAIGTLRAWASALDTSTERCDVD